MNKTRATLAAEAVCGLRIVSGHRLMLVNDGTDEWLCEESAWNEAIVLLAREPATEDDDTAEAYTRLCRAVKGAVATKIGVNRGDWQRLVNEAYTAGMIDANDARAYGVEIAA